MAIFLVKGTVHKSYYMDDDKREEVTRLVQAETIDEATEKFERHFEDKNVDFAVYYRAYVDDISKMIE